MATFCFKDSVAGKLYDTVSGARRTIYPAEHRQYTYL